MRGNNFPDHRLIFVTYNVWLIQILYIVPFLNLTSHRIQMAKHSDLNPNICAILSHRNLLLSCFVLVYCEDL